MHVGENPLFFKHICIICLVARRCSCYFRGKLRWKTTPIGHGEKLCQRRNVNKLSGRWQKHLSFRLFFCDLFTDSTMGFITIFHHHLGEYGVFQPSNNRKSNKKLVDLANQHKQWKISSCSHAQKPSSNYSPFGTTVYGSVKKILVHQP